MPWYFPWSESLKKRACRYLLQYYLGNFLKEKLTLDQLSVDLYNGTGLIKDVQLDVWTLNEALENYSVPFEIVDGFIGSICMSIPWSALVSDNTILEINGLELTVQPKQRPEKGTGVMIDSMLSSMTTSMQLAQECLKQDAGNNQDDQQSSQPFEGLEMFAQTIESVLTKVKVAIKDSIFRLEHTLPDTKVGIALEIKISRIDYFDDLAQHDGSPVDQSLPSARNVYEPAAKAHKNFHLMGVTMYTDQFTESERTLSSRSTSFYSTTQGSPKTAESVSPPLSPQPDPLHQIGSDSPKSLKIPVIQSEPIKMAVFQGKQELKIKIKQSEELPGPKLEVESQFGSILFHLSPSQVHLLSKLVSSMLSPVSGSGDGKLHSLNKPMQPDDYYKVEHELQKQLHDIRIAEHMVSKQPHSDVDSGFTHHIPMDSDDDDDEMYYDLVTSQGGQSAMDSSFSSTITSKSTSTQASSVRHRYGTVYYQQNTDSPFQATLPKAALLQQPKAKPKSKAQHKDTLHRLLDDPAAEVTKYKVKLSFFSLVILHEDPVATPTSDSSVPGQSEVEKLKTVSEAYFSRAGSIGTMGHDLETLRGMFAEVCPYDHLQMLGKPFNLDLTEKMAAIGSFAGEISVGLFDFVECLFDRRAATSSILGFSLPIDNVLPTYTELLTFVHDVSEATPHMFSSMQAGGAPCIKVQIQSIQKSPSGSRRGPMEPKSHVHVELGHCKSELDITLMDRISALLNPQPMFSCADDNASRQYKSHQASLYMSQQACFRQVIDDGPSSSDSKIDLRITSPMTVLTLKFPIPDLRSGQGTDRSPWWRKSLRKESLILELTEADFQTTICSSNTRSKFEFTCKEIHGLFQESPQDPPMSFVRVSHGNDANNTGKEEGFDWPRIVISTFPQVHSELEEDGEGSEDSLPQDSLNGACQFGKTEPSPFSAKKAMYNNEEMVMPGDREEVIDFLEKSASNTQLLVEISLPNVNCILPSKQFFEVLYNRINNDLLLWEPLAPAPLATQDGLNTGFMLGGWNLDMDIQMMQQQQGDRDMFQLCRSGIQYDSSSDSDDAGGQYYSVREYKLRQRRKRRMEQAHLQSKACINFTITKGSLLICLPMMDDLGKPSEEFEGRVQLDLSDANFVHVVAHNGDPEMQLLCITANQVAVFHSGKEPIMSAFPTIERLNRLYQSSLEPTFYLAEPGVHTKLTGRVGHGGDSIDQLAVALRIKMDTFRNVKEFLVALGIRGTTLYHRTLPSNQSWLTQVMDFFTVEDYPILGYTMPAVLTELHIHFTGCSVDYRPRFLAARAMLTVENFSISSNIVADSPTSLLRFMVDDAALYISQQCNAVSVDLKKNYVCVMDIGLFELTLRCSDGKDPKYPKMDLWASNNIVHIHTCADSCRLLQDLIKYLASDADLERIDDMEKSSPDGSSVCDQQERAAAAAEACVLSDSPKLRQSHMEEVHDMMADAMQESVSDSQYSAGMDDDFDGCLGGGAEIFFFPDEAHKTAVAMETAPAAGDVTLDSQYPNVMTASGTSNDTDHYSEDEEFCIIDDPGLGIAPRGNEPSIRVLSDEPLVIQENFFSTPLTKADQLKAPDAFPPAEYKYTLQDMSLVWNMYGGSDLSRKPEEVDQKTTAGFEVHYTNRGTEIYKSPHSSKKGKQMRWQARGGPGRNLDTHMELHLSKVSMQHEIYPESTVQASRQILIINDIEIRDRLSTSKINKFLYQYSSESVPRRSHANMLQVKAVHRRPDPALPAQECSLKISLQPVRLNVDQDSLFFLGKFFSEVSNEEKEIGSKAKDCGKPFTPPPVMTVGGQVTVSEPDPQELLIMFDTMTSSEHTDEEEAGSPSGTGSVHSEASEAASSTTATITPQPQPTYFKHFIFSPDVLIRVDYHGKHVDMQQGTIAGLIVGLAQLNCSEIRLKRLDHRHGLLGVDRLAMYAVREWITDIKNHQLPSILGGVGPLHSFVQLYQGVRDLFWLPLEQFRKDGRIVRGLQRGAQSFTMSTAAAALELTNRMVLAVQFVAEITYDMVSPGPSVRKRKRHKLYRRIAQPTDLREGMTNAYLVVREGITGTAQEIYKVATEEHQHKGVTGAVGGVLRQIPPTVLQPVILATEATSEVLGGMRNQLLPDARKEQEEKWKQQC